MNMNHIEPIGWLSGYFKIPLALGAILILADILILLISPPSALVLTTLLVVYFVITGRVYFNHRALLTRELVKFAEGYSPMEGRVLQEMEIPFAILDRDGRFVWMNEDFSGTVHKSRGYNKSITTLFSPVRKESLPADGEEKRMDVEMDGENYVLTMRGVSMKDITRENSFFNYTGEEGLVLITLSDNTAVRLALKEVDDQSLVVGYCYIDNYEEAMETLEDVRKSLLAALVDRKVSKYVASYDGICGKLEKDRYLIVIRKKALRAMQEEHFPITEDVKTVKVGNEMAITISVGFGLDGLTYSQNLEFARNAVDISLGRGGDQVTVKTPDDTVYYGGKTQQVEKSKKVRSRIMAQALKELIRSRDVVYIMGHRLGDPDSFGAAIGVYRIAKTLGHKAHIIINERTTSLSAILTLFEGNPEYEQDLVITGTEAMETVTDNSMLVVVDVNKPGITECPDMLRLCKTVVVLDHHRKGTEYIENTALSYVESYVSSACELVTELIQYTGEGIKITPEEADALYGGIVVDTDNFLKQTGVRTFEASAYLKRNGADGTRVRKLFRENAREYKARADVVSQAEIYRDQYAISICPADGLASPTVVGAQAANEMLNIKGIRASFVLTDYNNEIFISARSLDDVNVQRVMERMGGGGHMTIAGCQLKDITVVEAIGSLKRMIDTMIEEGEL